MPTSKLSSAQIAMRNRRERESRLTDKDCLAALDLAQEITFAPDMNRVELSLTLKVISKLGIEKSVSVQPGDLYNPSYVLKIITNQTNWFPGNGRSEILKRIVSLQDAAPLQRLTLTSRNGWHDFEGNRVYVRPCETIPPSSALRFDPQTAALDNVLRATGEVRGTLKSWQKKVGSYLKFSSHGVALTGVALAAPLLKYSQLSEDFAIVLVGESSSGKSTMINAAKSIGSRADESVLPSPNLTERGFDELAFSHNDAALFLGDVRRARQSDKAILIQWLTHHGTSGGHRRIAKTMQTKGGLPTLSYRTIVAMTSNENLSFLAKMLCLKRDDADAVRMFEIDVADATEGGVFDMLKPGEQRGTSLLQRNLSLGFAKNYGAPMAVWLEWLQAQPDEILAQKISVLSNKFVDNAQPGGTGGAKSRAAMKFGLIFSALMLARDAGILTWPEELILTALQKSLENGTRALDYNQEDRDFEVLDEILRDPKQTVDIKAAELEKGDGNFPYVALKGCSVSGVEFIGLHRVNFSRRVGSEAATRTTMALERHNYLAAHAKGKGFQMRVGAYGKPRLRQLSNNFVDRRN